MPLPMYVQESAGYSASGGNNLMIRRLLILIALVMPLPAAAVIGGSGLASAAQIHTYAKRIHIGPPGFTFCAPEGTTCNISGTADIAYGVNGRYYYAYGVTGAIPCDNAVFGDPSVGVKKSCYTKKDTGPSGYSFCVTEGQICTFPGHANIAYGADGKFFYRYGVATAISCSNAVFTDPDQGVVKGCYIKRDIGPSGYTFCATEGQTCPISGPADVAFGADGKFLYKKDVTGNIACTVAVFGDPDEGVVKACYVRPI